MTRGATSSPRQPSSKGEALSEREILPLLRLLGSGAASAILLALGESPLRTHALTTQVSGYAPRTIYRYVRRLGAIGVIEREEEPGVPTKVVHSLADPCGADLYGLVKSYSRVSTSLEQLRDGRIVPQSWGSLTLLADLWESGLFKALNAGPCTATELARVDHDLSFHQVSRRISLLVAGGMIREAGDGGRGRRYELTEEARQAAALIAGLGQWRECYAVPPGEPGLTVGEVTELLRSALPLVALPEHGGKCFKLIVAPSRSAGEEGQALWVEVKVDGAVVSCNGQTDADGWGRGGVAEWIKTLLGAGGKIRTGGEGGSTVKACLQEIGEALWPPEPLLTPAS